MSSLPKQPLLAAALLAIALPAAADTLILPTLTVEGEALSPALTQPDAETARLLLQEVPGAAEVVGAERWQSTPAVTLKDILDYSAGVFVQPKWGEDTRLAIRGSGLSRNFHMRGVALYQDGVPVNASDGGSDFQEIDPTAFGYAEVYKGANALRYGTGTLGGAVNLVSPSGYDSDIFQGRADMGSFGFHRLQASGGGVIGPFDFYLAGSWAGQEGYRDHTRGESVRFSGNAGWKIGETLETRFYVNLADIWQEIPGSVTKEAALKDPRKAAMGNLVQDYQRNMQSWRLANKTTFLLDSNTLLEFGGYAVMKELQHPIYQYLDYSYRDFGGFLRARNEARLFGLDNRLTGGVTLAGGWVDNRQYVNLPGGIKGSQLSGSKDSSLNISLYGENALEVLPGFTLVLGLQYLHAERERDDRFAAAPDTSGSATYDLWNPKAGFVWQVTDSVQVFGNVSRSGEPPTFSELNFTNAVLQDLKAQRATTFELGTRGELAGIGWDIAFYRAHLKNEFQFFDLGGGAYAVSNADKTLHQGVEAAASAVLIEGLLAESDDIWLRGAYTFSDFRFDGDAAWGDNELPGAPRHYLRAELLYRNGSFSIGPNIEWVPQGYYADNANTLKTDPYALLGMKASYAVNERISFFLDARNLLDERYIASSSVAAVATPASALFEPGTGLSLYGGIGVRW